jgi:hypothetical protein
VGAVREVYELPDDHRWTARPGYQILVLDRGAVVLEFPRDWFVQPGAEQTDIRDRASPDNSTCVLAVSYLRLPAADWSGLPLRELLLPAAQGEEREHIGGGAVIEARHGNLDIAWTELRVVDARERREALCRFCLARSDGVQCVISFDFWPEDEARLHTVWENVLDSLRLNASVEDPTRGKRIE